VALPKMHQSYTTAIDVLRSHEKSKQNFKAVNPKGFSIAAKYSFNPYKRDQGNAQSPLGKAVSKIYFIPRM